VAEPQCVVISARGVAGYAACKAGAVGRAGMLTGEKLDCCGDATRLAVRARAKRDLMR